MNNLSYLMGAEQIEDIDLTSLGVVIAEKMSAQNLEDIKQKDWPVIVKKIDEVYKSIL